MTDRRKAELERHLKAAFQTAGQAHIKAKYRAAPETIMTLIRTAQDELEKAEAVLWQGVKAKTS